MKVIKLMPMATILLFIACGSANQDSEFNADEAQPYLEQGEAITRVAFKTLSTNLKMAMTRGGVEEAAGFCNMAAQPITDSLSEAHGVIIKRTSLKLRNPENKPDNIEQTVLEMFATLDDMGKKIEPKILLDSDDKVRFFAPIMVKSQCLVCHGVTGQSLTEENYTFIKSHYPEDQAINYNENDLRGIWSITFIEQPAE